MKEKEISNCRKNMIQLLTRQEGMEIEKCELQVRA